MPHPRDFVHGQAVRVDGSCQDADGQSVRGLRGEVYGANPVAIGSDGKERVNVKLEDGTIAAVPPGALRKK